MKNLHRSRGKEFGALLALPLLLSFLAFTPVQATQRVVLVEEWENTS